MSSRQFALNSQRVAAVVIPLIVVAVNAYAIYVVAYTIAVKYLLQPSHEYVPVRRGSGIAILLLEIVLFIPVALSYIRFVHVLITNPGYVRRGKHPDGEEGHQGNISEKKNPTVLDRAAVKNHQIPFPPGYEQFSQRQVFTCSTDGLPRFCNTCWTWKPDRSHHCSELNRCVRRFDHYCPWVGGVVSETNFKFFVQFTGYASIYAVFLFVVLLWTILTAKHDCHSSSLCAGFDEEALNWNWIAAIVLTGLFGIFMAFGIFSRFGMYVLTNRTTIESLESGSPRTCIAVRVYEWELQHISTTRGYLYTTFPLGAQQMHSSKSGDSGFKDSKESGPKATTESTALESKPSNPEDEGSSTIPTSDLEQQQDQNHQTEQLPHASAYAIFIILTLPPGSNIWDVGTLANIRYIMGDNIIDWFVPWKLSPCIKDHEPGDDISEYRLGKDFHEVERTALPHRYDERGKRKEPLYAEEKRSSSQRRRRRTRKSNRTSPV